MRMTKEKDQMFNPSKLSYDEFHAVWEALNQYVDNNCAEEGEELHMDMQARIGAARAMIEKLDAAACMAGECVL